MVADAAADAVREDSGRTTAREDSGAGGERAGLPDGAGSCRFRCWVVDK